MRQLLGVLRLGVGLVLALAAAVPGHAAGRFEADDFRYLGAFRLPVCNQPIEGSTTDVLSWVTKGVETYYPAGDPAGPPDGFTGSLYGIGHAWVTRMFEINIPAPVISKNLSDLPVATLLQTPTDVAGPIEISGDGLKAIDYLTQQSGMDGDKLHIAVGQHYQYDPRPTHGWTNLTMDPASTVGPWYVGYENLVSCLNTNDWIVTIPKDWADQNVGGMRLACGRYREGQVATGPSLIAYAPWMQGDPPPANTHLNETPLVLYRNLDALHGLRGFCNADNWTGAAWLDNSDKAAVLVAGTKGLGNCWYGWQDGTTMDECSTWPGGCEANGYGGSNRGYYADAFRTVILFYDPGDLAKVAHGQWSTWTPQPYLMWDITPYMIQPESTYEIEAGGVAYDSVHGYIYVTEKNGDHANMKPIVHVFKISPSSHDITPGNGDPKGRDLHGHGSAYQGSGGPLSVHVAMNAQAGIANIRMAGPVASQARRVTILDVQGRLVRDLGTTTAESVAVPTRDLSNGVYFVRVESGTEKATGKVVVVH